MRTRQSRKVYVHDAIFDGAVERLTKEALTLKAGNPGGAATRMGLLISQKAAQYGRQLPNASSGIRSASQYCR